jgi:hypothetical protein
MSPAVRGDVVLMVGSGLMVMEKDCVPVPPTESVTLRMAELKFPVAVGVPLMTPEEAFMESPVGKPVAEKVRVPVPPMAVTVYGVNSRFLSQAEGGVGEVILGPAIMLRVSILEAVPPAASVTLKVREVGPPAVVGVPLMMPVEAARDKPVGRTPDVMLQVNGEDPSLTTRVWE